MNGNTVPEQRVNKLGHTVTKHVRAQKAPAPVSVPPVSPPPPVDHVQRLTDCATRLYIEVNRGAKRASNVERRVITNIRDSLGGLNVATLERIEVMDSRHTHTLLNMVLSLRDERVINDFMVLADVMADEEIDDTWTNHYLRSLVHFQGLVPQGEDNEYPEERRDQCIAIVRVMDHMRRCGIDLHFDDGSSSGAAYINDDNLRELLISGEGDREAMVRVIIESSVFDADQVKSLAETVHPSLLGGAL